jgi:hypothetical protein
MREKERLIEGAKFFHDALSAEYYSGKSGMTKEEFDLQHAAVWDGLEEDLNLVEISTIVEAEE